MHLTPTDMIVPTGAAVPFQVSHTHHTVRREMIQSRHIFSKVHISNLTMSFTCKFLHFKQEVTKGPEDGTLKCHELPSDIWFVLCPIGNVRAKLSNPSGTKYIIYKALFRGRKYILWRTSEYL